MRDRPTGAMSPRHDMTLSTVESAREIYGERERERMRRYISIGSVSDVKRTDCGEGGCELDVFVRIAHLFLPALAYKFAAICLQKVREKTTRTHIKCLMQTNRIGRTWVPLSMR